MKLFKSSILAVLIGSLVLIGCEDNDSTTDSNMMDVKTMVRVVHTSYDAPAVDVLINDQVALSNLSYGMTSGYAEIDAGTSNIKVVPFGATTPVVIEADLNLEEDMQYSVYAVNNLANISAVVSEDNREPVSSKAKVRFLHSSPDAPAVDIKLNSGSGPAVFSNASFGDIADYIEVDQGTYNFVVTPSGSTNEVVVFDPIDVASGSVYTVIAHGTLDNTDEYDFATRVFIDNDMGDMYADLVPAMSKVKVTHASPDAPGVDLLIDGIVINTSALTFPNNTGYLGVAAGTRNIKVNASGSTATVIEADLTLGANKSYSVFATDVLANITPVVIEDDLTTPALGKAHVRFLHLSPDAPAVNITLTDGTVVFPNAAFQDYTSFTPLDAGSYELQVRLAGTETVVLTLPTITVTDGMIYTVFAKGLVANLAAEIIVNN
ncbi:DUF4397 domain-containing protein [Candidatus Neomarinimicrobiota bacterium]